MDNPRPEKVAVVDEVRDRLRESGGAILTEYRGLKTKDLQALRRSLREAGGEYKVYKNTLVGFAASDLGIEGVDRLLKGPTGIAFARQDPSAVAKVLRDFARTNNLLVIKGGVLDSKVLDGPAAVALADLPSREVLLAQFAGLLSSPLQKMLAALSALPRSLAYGLVALRDQMGGPEPAIEVATPAVDEAPAEAPPAEAADTVEAPSEERAAESPSAEVSDVVEPPAEEPAPEPEVAEAVEPAAVEPEPDEDLTPTAAAEPEPAEESVPTVAAEPEPADEPAPTAAAEPESVAEAAPAPAVEAPEAAEPATAAEAPPNTEAEAQAKVETEAEADPTPEAAAPADPETTDTTPSDGTDS